MNNILQIKNILLTCFAILFVLGKCLAQQQDVPEPVFMNFFIQPLYVPSYHGRDPFKPLDNLDRLPQVSIAELEYHGIIILGESQLALFTWKGNSNIKYVLKFKKLFSGEKAIDGVAGDITASGVILVQGEQKIVYPRR